MDPLKSTGIKENQIDRDNFNNSNQYSHKSDKALKLGVTEHIFPLEQLS